MARKTNIVLVLVDELGFADLGCSGSEISTPDIDAGGGWIAANGDVKLRPLT
jgi:arylsulfatase A-like enzyme